LVQLRDLETWKHVKGVQSGDVGPKVGYVAKDNGWARFDNVRIPRTNLLMGYVDVDRQGNFKKKGDLRVLYTVMMIIRAAIVGYSGFGLQKAVLIGIRYSIMRRQFQTLNGSTLERPILDYQTQRHVFAVLLSKVFVMQANGRYTDGQFLQMMEEIKDRRQFSKMDPMHHLLSGLKALYSAEYFDGAEEAR